MTTRKIPLNFFGMPFGLAALAGAWSYAAARGHVPGWIGDVIVAASAAIWLGMVVMYLRYVLSTRGALGADLRDPVAAPFASLAVIVPMLIAVDGIAPHAFVAGRAVFDVFLVLTVLLGAWFTGQWIYTPLDLDKLHPGYFLPTVAGGLIGALGAAAVGQQRLAEVMLGLGLICWLIVGSMILARLFFRPALPDVLLPTLAIEVAPAAVATLAYLTINGDHIDALAAGLGGYGLLMVLTQVRLLPAYLKLPFAPGTWAFTFSWAAVATAALHWLDATRPPGYLVYTALLLAAITALVAVIAGRTLVAVARHQLLPSPVAARLAVGV